MVFGVLNFTEFIELDFYEKFAYHLREKSGGDSVFWFLLFTHAPVAQGIGRQPPELKIAGSSPAGRTIHQSYSVSFKKIYMHVLSYPSSLQLATQVHLTPQITKPSIVKGRIQQLNCACGLL